MSQPTPKFPVDPAQREVLKAALLARHAQRYPVRTARAHPWLPRLLMAGALCALLAVSFAAPAEHEVEVGRRLTLVLKGESGPPSPQLFRPLLEQIIEPPATGEQPHRSRELQVRLERKADGLTLQVELWGARLVPGAAERLRAGLPALKDAAITDEPLRGRVRTRLGLDLGRRLLGLTDDPEQIAAARARLQADLAARGQEGEVDIKVETGADGQRKVRVQVEAKTTEAGSRELPEAK